MGGLLIHFVDARLLLGEKRKNQKRMLRRSLQRDGGCRGEVEVAWWTLNGGRWTLNGVMSRVVHGISNFWESFGMELVLEEFESDLYGLDMRAEGLGRAL